MMQHACWLGGWLVLAAAWCGPLPRMAGSSFSAHMSLHMLLVAAAAPLLALGLAGGRRDPVRYVPSLFAPLPASIAELILVWAWHAPALHHAARHTAIGFVTEQATFVLVGLWLWLSAFGGQPVNAAPGPEQAGVGSKLVQRRGAGVLALLLTSMHMTLLGALLALSPRLLFEHPHAHGGLSPLADQHLGGAIMLVVGGIVYLLGGLALTADVVRANRTFQSRDAL